MLESISITDFSPGKNQLNQGRFSEQIRKILTPNSKVRHRTNAFGGRTKRVNLFILASHRSWSPFVHRRYTRYRP